MAETLFDIAAEQLEQHAGFDRLAARGTLRLVAPPVAEQVDAHQTEAARECALQLLAPGLAAPRETVQEQQRREYASKRIYSFPESSTPGGGHQW